MKTIVTGQDERVGRWVCERTHGTYSSADSVAIGLEENGELIAGVLYDHWNGKSLAMHVAGEGKWLNREFLWYSFHYAFEQCGASKVLGFVSSANTDALRFDRHLGFKHEATIKDACPNGDIAILGLAKADCRWLKLRNRYGRQIRSPSRT